MDKKEMQELVTALLVMLVGGLVLVAMGWSDCGMVILRDVVECAP